jgi:hypothetical protein
MFATHNEVYAISVMGLAAGVAVGVAAARVAAALVEGSPEKKPTKKKLTTVGVAAALVEGSPEKKPTKKKPTLNLTRRILADQHIGPMIFHRLKKLEYYVAQLHKFLNDPASQPRTVKKLLWLVKMVASRAAAFLKTPGDIKQVYKGANVLDWEEIMDNTRLGRLLDKVVRLGRALVDIRSMMGQAVYTNMLVPPSFEGQVQWCERFGPILPKESPWQMSAFVTNVVDYALLSLCLQFKDGVLCPDDYNTAKNHLSRCIERDSLTSLTGVCKNGYFVGYRHWERWQLSP